MIDFDKPDEAAAELTALLEVLPEPLRAAAVALGDAEILEIVMDLGRLPEARLVDRAITLSDVAVSREQLAHVVARTSPMGADNRAGIERTLHRISGIRNRKGEVIGLTLRVGRAVFGTIDMLKDLIETGRNVLLLGRPGIGKTTKLREVARVLADDLGKRVVIVDTSNEIGGDGDVPHAGIGRARRMQVAHPERQHAVMIEAVENHMPEAIIVDEIGTAAESAAARTIAERGVQLVGTAHGTTLENLLLNPTLSDLVGGLHTVTLGDEEARRRHSQKTTTERKGVPTFDSVVELVDRGEVVVHRDTAAAVDRLLSGQPVAGERRRLGDSGVSLQPEPPPDDTDGDRPESSRRPAHIPSRIYVHAVSPELLRKALSEMHIEGRLVNDPASADVILALRGRPTDRGVKAAAARGAYLQLVKRNSAAELRRALRGVFTVVSGVDEGLVREAMRDAEETILRVKDSQVPAPMAPRPPALRKMQHRLVARHHLEAASSGREPFRHLVVYPAGHLR